MKIAELKTKVPIDELLANYGWTDQPAMRSGWQPTPCPFHEDHNPSAQVEMMENRFRCFGCDVQGDIVDIVQQVELLADVREAKRYLEEHFLGESSELDTRESSELGW